MEYTIKGVMPTGKHIDKYGGISEYYIQFEGDEGSYNVWFQKTPAVGNKLNGTIKEGKFEKDKTPPAAKPEPHVVPDKKAYKDNSDGMRQGMCFNNAAAYVATLDTGKALSPEEWAKLTFKFARALYLTGDLDVEQQDEVQQQVADVKSVFGVTEGDPSGN